MKYLAIFTALLLLLSLLTACAGSGNSDDTKESTTKEETTEEIPSPQDGSAPIYDAKGKYLGFANLKAGYTALQAVNDGCLVISLTYDGASVLSNKKIENFDKWTSFVERSEQGENTFLRIVLFIDGIGYCQDLYHYDNAYILFENTEYGVFASDSFTYLRRLEHAPVAEAGEDEELAVLYVLTDSTTLTYDNVANALYGDEAETGESEADTFKWLGFAVFFDE